MFFCVILNWVCQTRVIDLMVRIPIPNRYPSISAGAEPTKGVRNLGLPPIWVGCYLPVTCPADSAAEVITL